MSLRPGKLIPILLVPALVYGGLKGFLYYKTQRTVDEIVVAAANQADIRYTDISTDLRGAVTVGGISVQPVGHQDAVHIGSIRIASDDPMFFFRSAGWTPGEGAPPSSLSFMVNGVNVPLSADFVRAIDTGAAGDGTAFCDQGLQINPQLLSRLGFSDLAMDVEGHYRMDKSARTLEFGMDMELKDIESMHVSGTLADVDVEALSQGAAPQVSLGGFSVALRVAPDFGRQALKLCAAGTEDTVHAWSERLAQQAVAQFEEQGLVLGDGLSAAVRAFYRDWGEAKLVASPRQPIGLLSLLFLPPEQLAGALGLQLSVNGEPVADTSFSWQGPSTEELSMLFGGEETEVDAAPAAQPQRIVVRREYEPVSVRDIKRYVNHQVHIKPRGQPLREGVLKRINDGEAEVEQSLHGGKYTVYVPLHDIESMQALVQREIGSAQ